MIEVWWPEDGREVCRAKFRTRSDALRYVWRYGRVEDSRIHAEDGSWQRPSDFPRPKGVLTAPPEALIDVPTAGESDGGPNPRSARTIDVSDIALEVMRNTNIADAKLVEKIVRATLAVLKGMRRSPEQRSSRPPPSG